MAISTRMQRGEISIPWLAFGRQPTLEPYLQDVVGSGRRQAVLGWAGLVVVGDRADDDKGFGTPSNRQVTSEFLSCFSVSQTKGKPTPTGQRALNGTISLPISC